MVHPTSLILDKNMLGNIGHLFVKCRRQVTKGHEYHLLVVLYYYVMYRHRASQFCETSANITDWVTDSPLDGFVTFLKSLWLEVGNFDVSPYC